MSWPNPSSVASTFLLLAFIVIPIFFYVFWMEARQQNAYHYATLVVRMATCLAIVLVFTHSAQVASGRLLMLSVAVMTLAAAV